MEPKSSKSRVHGAFNRLFENELVRRLVRNAGYLFGANLDQSGLAPDRVFGSAVIDLPRAFLAVAREVRAGSFSPRVESFGLRSGVIRYEANPALESRIPDALRQRLQQARDSIVARDTAGAAQ